MKSLQNIILEKLTLSQKNVKSYSEFDKSNKDMIIDIIKATFICVYKNFNFKIAGTSRYVIKRTEVKYDDIAEILNEFYHYQFAVDEFTNIRSDIHKFIKKTVIPSVQLLVNMKTIVLKIPNSDEQTIIKGKDIYFNDWTEYRKNHKVKVS